MESNDARVRKSKTLFVRNLPFTTTNEKLGEAFSDIGPIKQCFVVKDKGSDKCKGYGYVTFSLFDDAENAKEKIKSLDGRKLYVSYADRKKDEKKKKLKSKPKSDNDDKEDGEEEKKEEESKPTTTADQTKLSKSNQDTKYLQAKTLVLTGLKDDCSIETLQNCIQKLNVKNVAKYDFPVHDRDEPTAFVRFKSVRDAKRGQRRLDGATYKLVVHHVEKLNRKSCYTLAMKIKAIQLNKENVVVPQKVLKKARIIIRNLPFKCTNELLEKTFKKFGIISEVKIPQKPDGRMFGFGFVQFTDVTSASKAIQGMNTKLILGRPVAVDWAVPKDKFQAAKTLSQTTAKQTTDDDESESDEGSFSAESDGASDRDSDRQAAQSDHEADDASSSDEGFDDDVSSDESKDDDDTDKDEDESSSDDSDGGGNIKRMSKDKDQSKDKKKKQSGDVEEGRTLFIRNLSYDTEEDTLSDEMVRYGKLAYCRLVIDKNTEHPKGTAFIQFRKKEDADKCLNEANDESQGGGITIDGRKLSIAVAVSREKATQYKEKKEKEKIDKRNLNLAREGIIRAGTQAAQGLSKEDLAKRMKVEMLKRQKLKNPNIFVSSTRLCVRNLPTSVDEGQLKKVFLKAADNKSASISECRIMRDMARVSGKGVAKSRGFGFVNFTDHQHAIEALRNTNNNPDLFGEKKRLIVEFSLENKSALVAKDKRLDRIKARQESLKKNKNDEEVKEQDTKSQNRRKKQKQTLSDKFIGQTVITKGEGKQNIQKTLSSHWGPKIRHKPRPSQTQSTKKSKDKNRGNDEKQKGNKRKQSDDLAFTFPDSQEPSKKKRKRQKEKKDAFDDLVNKYKQKIMTAQTSNKTSKWFS